MAAAASSSDESTAAGGGVGPFPFPFAAFAAAFAFASFAVDGTSSPSSGGKMYMSPEPSELPAPRTW